MKKSSTCDGEMLKALSKCVEVLTTSGKRSLDEANMKKLKKICRTGDEYVKETYRLLRKQLRKRHAEIRLSAFYICDQLFRRSHCFRELLIADFQHFLEMAVETNLDRPLPPPKHIAKLLQQEALQAVQQWYAAYGQGYKKLVLGYNFLQQCKQVDFSPLQAREAAEERVQDEDRRQRCVIQERLKKVQQEMEDIESEIRNCLTQINNCFSLLLPHPGDFFIQENEETTEFADRDDECQVETEKQQHKKLISEMVEGKDASSLVAVDTDMDLISREENVQSDDCLHGEELQESEEMRVMAREHGLLNMKYNLTVEVQPENYQVKENSDNSAVLENLRDQYKLVNNSYLPAVKRWIHVITKAAGDSNLLKKATDVKVALETASSKFNEIHLTAERKTREDSSEKSDDSDFEEVKEKEGYEEYAKCGTAGKLRLEFTPHLAWKTADVMEKSTCKSKQSTSKVQPHWWGLSSLEEEDEKDPTTIISTLKNIVATKVVHSNPSASCSSSTTALDESLQYLDASGPSTSGLSLVSSAEDKEQESSADRTGSGNQDSDCDDGQRKLLNQAPKLPSELDLHYWDEDHLQAPTVLRADPELCRFWRPVDQEREMTDPQGAAVRRTRVIEFTGSFEPVKWSCRAPLPSGKLCPRRDRHKCPFHGSIIPRDDQGMPTRPEDLAVQKREEEEKARQNPDWQDPSLLQDIKAATGIDLTIESKDGKGRRKRKSKRKYPGLTDIRTAQNTPRVRLGKKIFNRRAVKRVATALDALDYKKYRDKFGNQWNYIHDKS